MFRVIIESGDNKNTSKRVDAVMKTEKLYELIGRFTLKYGPPMEVEITHGVHEYEFYKEKGTAFESCTLSFAKILNDSRKKRGTHSSNVGSRFGGTRRVPMGIQSPPPTPVGPVESDDPRLSELFTKGVLEASSYHR